MSSGRNLFPLTRTCSTSAQTHTFFVQPCNSWYTQNDLYRLAAAVKRDKYESRHMGNFRRIYPAAAPPLQAKYEWLLQGSTRVFATSMKAKAHNTIGRIQVGLSNLHWVYAGL